MKFSRILIVIVFLFSSNTFAANDKLIAERAWKPFFVVFRAAVKKRDRVTLRKMMSDDFFSSGGNDAGLVG